MVGQQCPKIEVPAPNSKKANQFTRDRVLVFIHRLFAENKTVRVEEIRKFFPQVQQETYNMLPQRKRGVKDSSFFIFSPVLFCSPSYLYYIIFYFIFILIL